MLIGLSGTVVAIILVAGVIGYYLLLHFFGLLKIKQAAITPSNEPINTDIIPKKLLTEQQPSRMTLPAAVENNFSNEEDEVIFDETFEFLDDSDTILLKEAEKVVDRIQDTIVHVASNPPNPEELTSKIKAIVSPYRLFLETEYYDSINTFIALTLERDCGIVLSTQELQALWN